MKKKSSVLSFFKRVLSILREYFSFEPSERINVISTTKEGLQMMNRLQEKSGVQDRQKLFSAAFGLLDLMVTHELNGGKVELVESNGVNRETLDLLEYLSRRKGDL